MAARMASAPTEAAFEMLVIIIGTSRPALRVCLTIRGNSVWTFAATMCASRRTLQRMSDGASGYRCGLVGDQSDKGHR